MQEESSSSPPASESGGAEVEPPALTLRDDATSEAADPLQVEQVRLWFLLFVSTQVRRGHLLRSTVPFPSFDLECDNEPLELNKKQFETQQDPTG